MKKLLLPTLLSCSLLPAGAQDHRPLYFYSKGILKEIIYPSRNQEVCFYEERRAGTVYSYQKIRSPREEVVYRVHAGDSLTFTRPSPEVWMRPGQLNLLTTSAFHELVVSETGEVSPVLQQGKPALVYGWKQRDNEQQALLEKLARKYSETVSFFSIDLEEEKELKLIPEMAGRISLRFYHQDGTAYEFQQEFNEKRLTAFIDEHLSRPSVPKPMESFFAQGVSEHQGWYDVEKRGVPQDYMACWLITASNLLQWWQDRYVEAGLTLPEGTPNGTGSGPYRMAIMDDAMTHFRDLEKGGSIPTGILWYVEGKSTDISNQSYPQPGTGGYLREVNREYIGYHRQPLVSYDHWETADNPEEALAIFSQRLLPVLQQGDAMGMDIKTHVGLGGALHAITIWGAVTDEQHQIKGLYFTDSDDQLHQLVYGEVKALEDPFFRTKVVALTVPNHPTYVKGCEWEILKVFPLSTGLLQGKPTGPQGESPKSYTPTTDSHHPLP